MTRRSLNIATVRATIVLPEKERKRLDRVCKASGAQSISETVRRAVQVYEQLLELNRSGRKIFIEEDGQMKEVFLL